MTHRFCDSSMSPTHAVSNNDLKIFLKRKCNEERISDDKALYKRKVRNFSDGKDHLVIKIVQV